MQITITPQRHFTDCKDLLDKITFEKLSEQLKLTFWERNFQRSSDGSNKAGLSADKSPGINVIMPNYVSLIPTNVSTNIRLQDLFRIVCILRSKSSMFAVSTRLSLFTDSVCDIQGQNLYQGVCTLWGFQDCISAFCKWWRSACSMGLWPQVYSGLVGAGKQTIIA